MQIKQLSSDRVLTTDDSSSEEEDDLMEKNLDTLLANQKSSRQLQEEQEEKERLELVKELKRDKEKPTEKVEEKKPEKDVSNIDVDGKILKIKRKVYNIDGNIEDQLITIKNPEGKRYLKYLAT